MTLARVVHDQIQGQGGEIIAIADGATGLEAWARKAQLAFDVAKALALTPFVPESLVVKKVVDNKSMIDVEVTTGNVLGVLLAGDELGLQPMAALRSVDIISGVPALRAIAQRAIVQAAGHELVVEQSNATSCVVKGRRKGSTEWQRSRWDIDRAKALGLAGKENWRKQPTAQLVARASAECARLIASDALLGMPYSVEELADGVESIAGPGQESEAKPTRRTAQRRSAAGSKPADSTAEAEKSAGSDEPPEPDFDGETPSPAAPPNEASGPVDGGSAAASADPDPETPSAELASTAQLRKLHILLGEHGLSDRDAGLAYISSELGRKVESSKTLTKGEASQLIDGLERRAERDAAGPAEPPFEDVPLPNEPPLDEG